MPTVTLKWNSNDLRKWRTSKLDRALLRAAARAGSDAIRALKTASSKAIRERKRFKVARVNNALPIFYPRSKEDLVWRMDVSGKPVPLADFPYRQTKTGVIVQVNQGQRKLVRGAFVATMRSGHVGIFRRVNKARLPIKEAFTTRVSDVFNDPKVIPAVQARAQIVFRSSFERLLQMELEKLSG